MNKRIKEIAKELGYTIPINYRSRYILNVGRTDDKWHIYFDFVPIYKEGIIKEMKYSENGVVKSVEYKPYHSEYSSNRYITKFKVNQFKKALIKEGYFVVGD